ncbi:HAD-IA family hydrolase [Kosmotoga pacifica]|uniref:Haloacid dehalogenase n=1 Tax=Kosmotoga pacifica TaxID=1330330 RepID=A0A0G2ZAQ3_9BACT|nr:HAD-IA family hydrolase [Kosmotoga pacifica]AKI96659.1 hypothetical protein IX53_01180 [Kosmotoga pacifica]
MFKNTIWDFDGTLCNTYPSIVRSIKEALESFGYKVVEEEIFWNVKKTLGYALDYYGKKFGLGKALEEKFEELSKKISPTERPLYDYTREICELIIERGGMNFIITHRDLESTLKITDYYGITELFTEIVTRDHGFARKPDPEAFSYVVEKYSLKRKDTLAIGDRALDIIAAKNCGIKTCYFNEFGVSIDAESDIEITSFKELYELIKNEGKGK